MKTIIISILFFSLSYSAAMTIKDNATDKTLTSEVQLLRDLISCVKSGKTTQEIRLCSKNMISDKLSVSQKDRLLAWFELAYDLDVPEKCSLSQIQYGPKKDIQESKVILCAKYNLNGLDHTAKFYISEENNILRLKNIKTD